MWQKLKFDFCFLCFKNIYGAISGNLHMKYNKIKKKTTEYIKSENRKHKLIYF